MSGKNRKNDNNDEDRHIPRRLDDDDDIVKYLIGLEIQLKNANNMDETSLSLLISNVLIEIKNKTASCASDRRTHIIIEQIVVHSSLSQLLEIIKRFIPYTLFLSRNRFASHIMQSLISRLCYILRTHGITGHNDDNDNELNPNELKSSFLELINPLVNEISWLMRDMCATHVIRAMLSALAGIPVISERKGKDSRHQHSVPHTEFLENILKQNNGKNCINIDYSFNVPEEFHTALISMVTNLMNLSSSELQALVADVSGSVVLSLLLRILCNGELVEKGPELADNLVKRILQWDVDTSNDSDSKKLFYDMGGDKCGSHFLESVLECDDFNTIVYNLNNVLKGSASEFAMDGAGNFVLQACLRRLSFEMNTTKHSVDDESNMLANDLLSELADSDFIIKMLTNGKGGVVLWMIELARSTLHRKDDKKCSYWGEKLGSVLINYWTADGSNQYVAVLASKFTVNRDVSSDKANPTTGNSGTTSNSNKKDDIKMSGQQTLDARLLGSLLKLDSDVSVSTLTAICHLPGQVLFNIATSGPISRAILDPIYDNANVSATLISSITNSLVPYIGELACHFVGQHIIRRTFEKADLRSKEKIVKAIDASKAQLNKTKEGRASLRVVNAELFGRQPDEWKLLINKQVQATQMLMDLDAVTNSTKKKKTNDDDNDEMDDNDDNNNDDNDKKRKRKRKRKSAV